MPADYKVHQVKRFVPGLLSNKHLNSGNATHFHCDEADVMTDSQP